jgi:alkanesulfonate monooxygenase SsuD/methylene tetrahydromethanopterin reductase-like flavin-dependent oxidoreductase (luciferase family)
MSDPTLGVKLPMTNEPAQRPLRRDAGEWGEFSERLGYDSVWVSEGWGADVFVTMTEIARETTEIDVCSAVANVFSRSPTVLAMAATSIDRLS